MYNFDQLLSFLCETIKNILLKSNKNFLNSIDELRIRAEKALSVLVNGKEMLLSSEGKITTREYAYKPSKRELLTTLRLCSGFSLYSAEEEMKQGFMSLKGGYRIGICGKTVLERGKVRTIKDITSINIRIPKEIFGCGDKVFKCLSTTEGIKNTLIISPPGMGKTTILRDIIRQISDIKELTVGVVDERGELGGGESLYMGLRTDVLEGCPKSEGMIMLLRSMTPRVIAVDEIGSKADAFAIEEMVNSGVGVICTLHGSSCIDFEKKIGLERLASKKVFNRFVVLKDRGKPGEIEGVYNENFEKIG